MGRFCFTVNKTLHSSEPLVLQVGWFNFWLNAGPKTKAFPSIAKTDQSLDLTLTSIIFLVFTLPLISQHFLTSTDAYVIHPGRCVSYFFSLPFFLMYLSFYVFFVGFFICLENTALALAIAALKSSHHSHNRIDSIFYLWKVVSDRNPNFKAESLKGISWRKKKRGGGAQNNRICLQTRGQPQYTSPALVITKIWKSVR